MCHRCITALVTGAILAAGPVFAAAQTTPAASPQAPGMSAMSPFGKPATLQGAHVVIIDGSAHHELTADAAQIAHTDMSGMNAGNMMSSMGTNMALSAVSIVAGPIGAIAAPLISMFGHKAPPKPTMHMLIALPGSASSNVLSSAAPSFTIDYADIPGINPDAYTPELVKLNQTNDNWRVVAISESSDPAAFAAISTNGMVPSGMSGSHEAPKITESRVDYANVTVASRGHATIALAHALDPGEYGIVLRPLASQTDVSPASLLTVWDFSVQK